MEKITFRRITQDLIQVDRHNCTPLLDLGTRGFSAVAAFRSAVRRSPASAKGSQPRIRGTLAFSLLAMLSAGLSEAQTDQWLETVRGIHPYAAVSVATDSNLLRNPDFLDDDSDQYVTLEAGFDTELRLSRQRFLIDGRIYRTNYDRFSEFDHTGGDARLLWNWVAGSLWEGTLGYTYDRTLRDFTTELIPTNDMRNRNKVFGSANRWLTPRWRMGAQIDWSDISFTENDFLDKKIFGLGANLDYVSKASNSVGFKVAASSSEFTNRDNRDYDDFALGPTADWKVTGKTRIKADLGYETRRYDDLTEKDFDGFVGRVRAIWQATGKTRVEAQVYRDLSNFEDEIADYAIVDGVSLAPQWNITPKTSLRALASYERRDFQDAASTISVLSDRVDRVGTLGLSLGWQPRRNIALSLDFEAGSRDSNRAIRDYDYRSLQAGIKVGL